MSKKYLKLLLYVALSLAPLSAILSQAAEKNRVMVAEVNGAVSPALADYLTKTITMANSDPGVHAIIIRMDTPGGLDTAMRQIVKEIQASHVPVIVYVAPGGSRAASAGAFITIAAHVAAMAPGTNIGAASPISIGGGEMDRTSKKKITNDAAAYIRSLAEARGRNVELAEQFVQGGKSISESEALQSGIVDVVADDLPALLSAIDGRIVKTAGGERILATADVTVSYTEMSWREKLFHALSDPNVAYILMMLGFYGLFFELANPGSILPGIIGAICLILAFYSLQTLPVSYAGVLLLVIAIIMFILEIKVTSYGALTIGGIIAMVFGSLMLIESPDEYLRISLSLIVTMTLLTAGFFFFLVGSGLRAQLVRKVSGKEGMIGAEGVAETDIAPGTPGKVSATGELWNAESPYDVIPKGRKVEIIATEGLTLIVRGK